MALLAAASLKPRNPIRPIRIWFKIRGFTCRGLIEATGHAQTACVRAAGSVALLAAASLKRLSSEKFSGYKYCGSVALLAAASLKLVAGEHLFHWSAGSVALLAAASLKRDSPGTALLRPCRSVALLAAASLKPRAQRAG